MPLTSLPPLTGGPGSYVPVIIGAAWAKAAELSATVDTTVNDALALAATPPSAGAADTITLSGLPGAPTLSPVDLAAATALLDSTRSTIVTDLIGKYTTFMAVHFPADAFVRAAEDWINDALTIGGSGVNATVEDQLWERARSKILVDADRAQEELDLAWSGRRFAIPPGAFTHASLRVQRSAQDGIAEAARDRAIESFKAEIENVRLAVAQATSLRAMALQAGGAYMSTLAQAQQAGTAAASSLVDSQARFASTLTDFYRAQIAAAEIPVRVATTNAELKVRVNEQNLRVAMETLTQRVSAVLANAQMLATQAAAAFNAMHTQASVSGNDSTVTSIAG